MSDVIKLPSKQERIWVCSCGCSTFELLEVGGARCSLCSTDVEGAGTWFGTDPAAGDAAEPPVRDVQGNGSVDFVRRHMQEKAKGDDCALMVLAFEDGSVSVWSPAESDDEKNWAYRRLSDACALIEGSR